MALFGGVNNDRSPGTAQGRAVLSDAQKATRRTAPIPTAGFTPFQQQAFDLVGQQGQNSAVGAAQGFLPQIAGGQFVGQGPGQGILQQAAGGQFQNAALPGAQSALQFAQGISGGLPPGLLETAQGGNLGSPFLSGEFARQTDPIVDQFRNIAFPGLQGQFGASGLRGTNRQEFLEGQLQDRGDRALSGVAADLLGRERGFQQQAQLAIPGLQQNQLAGQLNAVGQFGNLSGGDIQNRLGAAGTLQSDFGQDISQAGQFGLQAPGFATGALGSQVNPLLQIGGLQQAQRQQQLSARDQAIQSEVNRAAQLSGVPQFAFQGGPQGPSVLGEGLSLGLSAAQIAALAFGGGGGGA